jgi:hypothetical protein
LRRRLRGCKVRQFGSDEFYYVLEIGIRTSSILGIGHLNAVQPVLAQVIHAIPIKLQTLAALE